MSLKDCELDKNFKITKKKKRCHRDRDFSKTTRLLDDLGRDCTTGEHNVLLKKYNERYKEQKEILKQQLENGEIDRDTFRQELRIVRTYCKILRDWRNYKISLEEHEEKKDKETFRGFFDESGKIGDYIYTYDKNYTSIQIRDEDGNVISGKIPDECEDVDEWLSDDDEEEDTRTRKDVYKDFEY